MLSFILQGEVVHPLQTLKMSSRTLKSYLVEIFWTKYWHIIDNKDISMYYLSSCTHSLGMFWELLFNIYIFIKYHSTCLGPSLFLKLLILKVLFILRVDFFSFFICYLSLIDMLLDLKSLYPYWNIQNFH